MIRDAAAVVDVGGRNGPYRPTAALLRPVETETVSPFRRRQVRRHRRPRFWRWLKRVATALAIAGTPAVVAGWLLTSPRFALAEARVELGNPAAGRGAAGREDAEPRVPEAWVRRELEPFLGDNLLRLPLAAVAERIERHPWVRAVDLSKELPASLRVTVVERREVALLRDGEELFYLDAEGRPIATLAAAEAAAAAGLAIVSRDARPAETAGAPGPELAAALDLLRELEAANPAWLAGLTEIEILAEEEFRVITTGLPFSLLVQAGTVEDRFRRLEELLPQLVERHDPEAVIDLRFEQRIIVEPSYRGPAAAGTQRRGDSG